MEEDTSFFNEKSEAETLDRKERRFASLLRKCLGSRFILRNQNTALFSELISSENKINQYLFKMGLLLKIENELGVAYLSTIDKLDLDYKIEKTVKLGPIDTLVLIFLRQKRMEHYSGDLEHPHVLIKKESIREFLDEFNTQIEDRKFQVQFERSIKRHLDLQVLTSTKEETLFEISAVTDILLSADDTSTLLKQAKSYFNPSNGGEL